MKIFSNYNELNAGLPNLFDRIDVRGGKAYADTKANLLDPALYVFSLSMLYSLIRSKDGLSHIGFDLVEQFKLECGLLDAFQYRTATLNFDPFVCNWPVAKLREITAIPVQFKTKLKDWLVTSMFACDGDSAVVRAVSATYTWTADKVDIDVFFPEARTFVCSITDTPRLKFTYSKLETALSEQEVIHRHGEENIKESKWEID